MRFTKNFLFTIVVISFLASAAVPVQAADKSAASTIHVQFQNNTGGQVWLYLTGPSTYSLALKFGKTTADVLQGKYNYSYQACGTTNTGTFNVRKNRDSLTLPACGESTSRSDMISITIQNKTGFQVLITLTAQTTHSYSINMGTSATDRIEPGRYTYSYSSCGKTQTGKFVAQKNGATLTLPKCGKDAGSGQAKITIFNNTGETLTIHFWGDQNYTFVLPGGRSRVYIKPGKYSYTALACGDTLSGSGTFKGGSKLAYYCY